MKIIGNTVGTPLPKPDLRQTNPKKGDYVFGSEEIVKTVNGIAPDENGNVEVTAQGGGSAGGEYTLPVGGAELGGVKNGGNVTINEDGTMSAAIPTDDHINDLINSALGVIENGTY